MSRLKLACLVTLITLPMVVPSSADAARLGIVPYGWKEKLSFVATTQLQDSPQGRPLSLCKLLKTHHVVWVNVWRSVEGYVLAPSCGGESYRSMSPGELAAAQRDNKIDAAVPAEPVLSAGEVLGGFLGLFIAGIAALGAAVAGVKRAARKNARYAVFGNRSEVSNRILDLMCHAAQVDGKIEANEIALIQSAGRQLTGSEFTEAQVRRALELTPASPSEAEFRAFGADLPLPQRMTLMKAALQVMGVDGKVSGAELEFLNKLAAGLALTQSNVDQILRPASPNPVAS